jgi:hypothetical protein
VAHQVGAEERDIAFVEIIGLIAQGQMQNAIANEPVFVAG